MVGTKPRSQIQGLAYRTSYKRRRSGYAKLCSHFGLLAFLSLLVSLGLFYFGRMSAPQFFWVVGASFIMAFLSVSFAVPALRDFFVEDFIGMGTVARGVSFSALVLVPLAWLGYQAVLHPKLNDVSTSDVLLPQFNSLLEKRRNTAFPNGNFSPASYALQVAAYPQLGPHRYATDPERVAESIAKLVKQRRWQVVSAPFISPIDENGSNSGLAKLRDSEGEQEGDQKLVPIPLFAVDAVARSEEKMDSMPNAGSTLKIELIAPFILPKLGPDVVIELQEFGNDTIVNMRAAGRHIAHDYGMNARLISNFLKDLDNELLGVAGEASAAEEEQ